MVAKGHDLPDVTVAGVLDADAALQQPDFRAEERAFSLIVQLAGRAGRRNEPATVFVQAWEPAARAVRLGARHAVAEFLDGEVERRGEHGFPPFGHLVRIAVEASGRQLVHDTARLLADTIAVTLPSARVMGPVSLHRLRERHRSAILVRGERAVDLAPVIRNIVDEHLAGRRDGLRVVVDVDPQDT
jgi:primosomal protein N' (replication factor Y)